MKIYKGLGGILAALGLSLLWSQPAHAWESYYRDMTISTRVFAALLLTGAAATGEAADWRYSVGVHDFNVPDVDSHTYGLNLGISVDRQTAAGRHVFGSADVFVDRDHDDLDPDHIPVWWQVHAGTDGELWKGERTHLGWTAAFDTRVNTVSSVERQIIAMPAIVAGYETNPFAASVQAGTGWFFLEIDDDVPKTRGYDRSDFRNSELGYSLAADLSLKLGKSWTAFGQAQEWRDNHDWLQNEYKVALRMEASHSHAHSSGFMLSADFHEYNLDVYARPDVSQPILPWNNDVMIRLSFDTEW
jgi:hypothetical protein